MLLYEIVHGVLFDLKPFNLCLCIHTCSGYSIVKSVSYNVFNSAFRQTTAFHALQAWLVTRFANLDGLAKQLLIFHITFNLSLKVTVSRKGFNNENFHHSIAW